MYFRNPGHHLWSALLQRCFYGAVGPMDTTISDDREREMGTNYFWDELGENDWLFSASPLLELDPEVNPIQEGKEYAQTGDSAPNFGECQVCASYLSGPPFSDPW